MSNNKNRPPELMLLLIRRKKRKLNKCLLEMDEEENEAIFEILKQSRKKIDLLVRCSGWDINKLSEVSGVSVKDLEAIGKVNLVPSREKRNAICKALGAFHKTLWPGIET